MDKLKQTKNLLKKLIKDEKSMFYATDRISRTLLNKARKLLCEKDKVFYKYYEDLDDENILYENENTKTRIPFYAPFVEQKKDVDQSSALLNIKGPFEIVHPDVADIRFFSRSAVDPKYCLLAMAYNLFISKMFVYPMKSKSLLSRKLELFS